ncbi:MAG: cysteine synthase family protein [Planctomycetota bacterium]
MPRIAKDVTWLVGRTPLLDLARYGEGLTAHLCAKLEFLNPTSSNKDRSVVAMVDHAERQGFLNQSTTIIECSAGDTAVSMAMVCAARGYRLVLTMPGCSTSARCNLLRALGAEIVTTEPERGTRGALERAEELAREIQPSLILQPFSNRANAEGHAATTAREIWEDTEGDVDVVVVPVGTGGTAEGCLRFFRDNGKDVRVVAVEPAASAVLSGGQPGPHRIPGLGAGFIPDILHASELDEVIAVAEDDAFVAVRDLARKEGVLAGPASGAVLHAARAIADRPENAGKRIVAVLGDQGERYEEHPCFAVENDG